MRNLDLRRAFGGGGNSVNPSNDVVLEALSHAEEQHLQNPNTSPQRGEEAILSEQERTLGVQVRGEVNSHTEKLYLQSDTNISRHTERKRKYPVTNPRELSCNKSSYIEINNQLDCFGSKEPHNDENIHYSRHSECNEESHNREDFANNAILRGLNNCSPQKDGKNSCRLTRGEVGNKSRKVAFTLAEVLITLGIIGVVAALTLPTLIKSYQKQVYVTQLKKVVNTMENNSRKILADEGVDSLLDTPLFTVTVDSNGNKYNLNSDYFEKHYKATKLPETSEYAKLVNNLFSDINLSNYYFDFGACISVVGDGADNDYTFDMLFDTNCLKQPNKIGYDRFTISFNGKGLVKNSEDDGLTPDICDELKDIAEDDEDYAVSWAWGGLGCYHKIVEDGWQIKY